jgi:hypothetical protein
MKLVALKTPAVLLVEGHHGRQWTCQDTETGDVVRVTFVDRGGADDGEQETIEIDIETIALPGVKK